MEYRESELTYTESDGNPLLAVLYEPDSNSPAPLVVDVHGGAWTAGHRRSDRFLCQRLAASGITVLSIDFRCGPKHQHPVANIDIEAAIAFAKSELAVDDLRVGLLGSSSGGHLALLSGLKPGGFGIRTSDLDLGVEFVVALWPVSNPLARYQYVLSRIRSEEPDTWPNFHPVQLAQGHQGYFVDQQAMHTASVQRVLAAHEYTALPRVMIVQPELDQNVPVFMSQTLHGALVDAGATVEYRLYPGVEHGFALAEGPQTEQCIADVIEFILD